jgi:transposase
VTDLPLSGRTVQLIVIARRFRCDAVLCGRQIFTERFAEGVLAPSARRTARLDSIVHHLGLALGGRPAADFARRLMLPVSKDTLLRVVRRRHRPPADPLKVIGIDDWAWRRNHRYASIICNLERRRIVTLLPDREPATAQAWLATHPTIAIVARDRGGGYGEAAARALPHAVQVADRWHLMENASRAFLDAIRKSMRQIRSAIGATTINPKLLSAAERLQYEGYLRREETNATILALSKSGTPIKQIVRQTGHSRKLVRQVIRGERTDVFRTRQSSLDPHLPWLDDQWASGCRNGAELWRRLTARGFRGSLRVISEWATRRHELKRPTHETFRGFRQPERDSTIFPLLDLDWQSQIDQSCLEKRQREHASAIYSFFIELRREASLSRSGRAKTTIPPYYVQVSEACFRDGLLRSTLTRSRPGFRAGTSNGAHPHGEACIST